jgi:hypothetical protein
VTIQNQRARLLGEAIAVICQLMKNHGVSRTAAERQLRKALTTGYRSGSDKTRRQTPWISSISSLNGRWHVEKNHVDKDGNPRPLTWNGSRGTLLRLAQKVVGKPKAKGAVVDLIRRKLLVRTADGKWLPKASVLKPAGLDRLQAERTAAMVHRLLRTVSHNSMRRYQGNDLLFEVITRVPRLAARDLPAFKRFTRSQGMVFARSVDEWLESRNHSTSVTRPRNTREAGVVVFAYEEPSGRA